MNERPVIGICTLYPANTPSPSPQYTSFLRHGTRIPALVYIFSPREINWTNKTIKGFTLENRRIVKKTLPFPQVVYNKLENRHQEALPLVRAMWKKFSSLGIKFFNPKFFNKIEIHRVLSANSTLAAHIPDTSVEFNQENLHQMLQKHSSVFVKPGGGSLGQGVIKISRSSGGYRYQYRTTRRNVTATVKGLPALIRRIAPHVGKRPIIQQAINLATYQGRVFDLRILMQKSGDGRWTRTFSFGKLAAPGSIAANVAAGGKVVNFRKIIHGAFPSQEKQKRVEEQINKLCFLIPSVLAKHFRNLGELGIDIGVDKSGWPWIIEVNSKYSRHVFPRQVRINSILNPLAYACRLAQR